MKETRGSMMVVLGVHAAQGWRPAGIIRPNLNLAEKPGIPSCLGVEGARGQRSMTFRMYSTLVKTRPAPCLPLCLKFYSQVMPKGKGLLSQGMAFSTSLFTDVAGVAMQGVRQVRFLCWHLVRFGLVWCGGHNVQCWEINKAALPTTQGPRSMMGNIKFLVRNHCLGRNGDRNP